MFSRPRNRQGVDPINIECIHHVAYRCRDAKEIVEFFKSIYFFDPNGHRIELAVDCGIPEMLKMLDQWSKAKRALQHARWMHDGSMSK